MRTIRADAFEHVSFGLHSVVATHKATNWKYYPSSPLKADVRIIVNDQTIGVYSVQNEDGDTEEVTVKFMSDFLPCKRCQSTVATAASRIQDRSVDAIRYD
jgi:hypothetical protein